MTNVDAADEALLERLLDGELTGSEAEAARAKLVAHPVLGPRLQQLTTMQARLRGLPSRSVPAGFEQRVLQKVEQKRAAGGLWQAWRAYIVMGLCAGATAMILLMTPQADQNVRSVGAAGLAPARETEMTLHLTAPASSWREFAMVLPGLPQPAVEAVAGQPSVFRAEVTLGAAAAKEAVGRLQDRMPVLQVKGRIPADGNVKLRIVLVEP